MRAAGSGRQVFGHVEGGGYSSPKGGGVVLSWVPEVWVEVGSEDKGVSKKLSVASLDPGSEFPSVQDS